MLASEGIVMVAEKYEGCRSWQEKCCSNGQCIADETTSSKQLKRRIRQAYEPFRDFERHRGLSHAEMA